MVNISFVCGGVTLSESNALDFGTVQAGEASAIKAVTVNNTGTSDAQQCVITAVEATIANGFSVDLQVGTAQETYKAQAFAPDSSGSWYEFAVLGSGKDYATKTGGTIAKTNGSDGFITKWTPPTNGTAGQKVWGNVFSCTYV